MKSAFSKITDYQLCQMIGSLIGRSDLRMEEGDDLHRLLELVESDPAPRQLRLPCDKYSLFLIRDRIPVFSDVVHERRSLLVSQLMDRSDETGLVADSLLSGKTALYLAKLGVMDDLTSWLYAMHPGKIRITTKPVSEGILMVTPLESFVFADGDDS